MLPKPMATRTFHEMMASVVNKLVPSPSETLLGCRLLQEAFIHFRFFRNCFILVSQVVLDIGTVEKRL